MLSPKFKQFSNTMFTNISPSRQKMLVRLSLVLNLFLLLYLSLSAGWNISLTSSSISFPAYRRTILNQYFTDGQSTELPSQSPPDDEVLLLPDQPDQQGLQLDPKPLLVAPPSPVSPGMVCHNTGLAFRQGLRANKYWVLYNYIRGEKVHLCNETITYTTHGDFTFLDNLEPLLERWQGPISVAVYAPGSDLEDAIDTILFFRDCTNSSLVRDLATFHIFFNTEHTPAQVPRHETLLKKRPNCLPPEGLSSTNNVTSYKKKNDLDYPVNVARNVARETVNTHFVFPSDIELYPSPGTISTFLEMVSRNDYNLRRPNPRVFVNSIFEIQANHSLPRTKAELIKLINKKVVIPFHKNVCTQCHNIPHAKDWLTDKAIKPGMNVMHIGKRVRPFQHWEPIYIGTNAEPAYDERLTWEGRSDKMTQGYKLCVLNYDFQILDNAFLIHRPGIKTKKTLHSAINKKKIATQDKLLRKTIFPQIKKFYGIRKGCEMF